MGNIHLYNWPIIIKYHNIIKIMSFKYIQINFFSKAINLFSTNFCKLSIQCRFINWVKTAFMILTVHLWWIIVLLGVEIFLLKFAFICGLNQIRIVSSSLPIGRSTTAPSKIITHILIENLMFLDNSEITRKTNKTFEVPLDLIGIYFQPKHCL